jgi:hypothetical protein
VTLLIEHPDSTAELAGAANRTRLRLSRLMIQTTVDCGRSIAVAQGPAIVTSAICIAEFYGCSNVSNVKMAPDYYD